MSSTVHIRIDRITIILLILACVSLVGAAPTIGQETPSQPAGWTPEEMMKVKGVGNVQVSPDGRRVVFTVTEAVMTDDKSENPTHIHMANADGSDARQLTYGDKSCTNPRWSPDDQWIVFNSRDAKKGYLGFQRLLIISAEGGTPRAVSPNFDGSAFNSHLVARWLVALLSGYHPHDDAAL